MHLLGCYFYTNSGLLYIKKMEEGRLNQMCSGISKRDINSSSQTLLVVRSTLVYG